MKGGGGRTMVTRPLLRTMVTRPLLFYIARITPLSPSMEGVNPVTYLLSMSQCILSLHVSNVSLMVLNWSSCLNIHKIILVVVSSQKFCNCLLTTSFLNIVLLKIVTSDSKNLRGQCFQISVNYFRSPTIFVLTF